MCVCIYINIFDSDEYKSRNDNREENICQFKIVVVSPIGERDFLQRSTET